MSKSTAGSTAASTTSPAEESSSYSVLYYKRKNNKVHKSKGVSKMDGVLTVLPPPKSLVILKDGNLTIFSKSQSPNDIAKKRDLEIDEVVVLGAYEVEIISRDDTPSEASTAAAAAAFNKPVLSRKPIRSATTMTLSKMQTAVRGPLHPKPASRPVMSAQNNNQIPKPTYKYKPPAQPKKVAPNKSTTEFYALSHNAGSSEDGENEDEDGGSFVTQKENSSRSSSLKRPLASTSKGTTTTRRPALKKQTREITPILPSSDKAAFVPYRRRPPPVPAAASAAFSSMGGTSIPSSVSTFFPGAIGRLDVPHAIKNVLNPHQIGGVTFLWNCLTGNGNMAAVSPHAQETTMVYKGAILADEMGLGKTLMTIATICALHRQKRDWRFVVVCPSSLVANWAKEFDKWLGKASQPKRVVVKKGGKEGLHQIKAFGKVKPNQSEVLILSYELFRMNAQHFQQIQKVGLLVVDEGHRLKNTAGSLTLTALESLPCDARLCITATPIQNILSDFFNLANFVCPGLLGDLSTFRKEYERPISASNNKNCSAEQKRRGLAQSRILDEITRSFMLRRLQKDVLKSMLPPRSEVLLFCRPTNVQGKLYKQITSQQRGASLGVTADALTTLTKLRKLCSHPALLEDSKKSRSSNDVDIALSGKLTLLNQLLSQIQQQTPEDKVVIVSNFTSALSVIEHSILKPHNLTYLRLDGTTELSNRQAIVDTFNKTSSQRNFAFLLSSKAGGCGLNLIGANRLVMFDPDWNPASDIQAMARVYRQGQKKPCTIYRFFTSGTVEEVICQRQIQKGNLAALTVDGTVPKSTGTATGFTKEELRDCFTLKENCDCDTKLKVGNRWPAYDGAASIESQGCTDPPLLSVAGDVTTPLAFVHVVNPEVEQVQAVTANCSTAYESDSSEEELQSSEDDSSAEQRKEGGSAYEFDISEEELQFSQEDSSAEQQKEEESSDEEFEF